MSFGIRLARGLRVNIGRGGVRTTVSRGGVSYTHSSRFSRTRSGGSGGLYVLYAVIALVIGSLLGFL